MSAERWPSGAHSSENIEANFQIDVIFINKLHIWTINKYILAWKPLKTTFRDRNSNIYKMILDLGVRYDNCCKKYRKRSDMITNCEAAVGVLISL